MTDLFPHVRRATPHALLCTALSLVFGLTGAITAQASPPVKIIRGGSSVELNGRETDLTWVQWQTSEAEPLRVGIRDLGSARFFGVDLLNTNDSAQQPVKWFSSGGSSGLTLPALPRSPHRYLDITPLAQKEQWELSVVGTRLKIVTPTASVTAIDQQPLSPPADLPIPAELLSAYRKLEIKLDNPAPWQSPEVAPQTRRTDDPGASDLPPLTPWTVTLAARSDPGLISGFPSLSENPILGIEQVGDRDRTALKFNVPVGWRPVVSGLGDPDRLLIEIRPDFLVERDILWKPGLRWRQRYVEISDPEAGDRATKERFPVFWLEVDLSQPHLSLEPLLSRSASRVGLAPLLTTASRSQAAAAINGGFFNRNTLFPLGAIRRRGRWLSSPILNRGAIGWTDRGEIYIDRLTRSETLVTAAGDRFPIKHLNSGYVEAGMSRYTSDWGSSYVPVLDREWAMVARDGRIVEHLLRETPVRLPIPIGGDNYLLVIRNNIAKLAELPVGTEVRIESQTDPPAWDAYPQILAAGPLLLRSGEIVLDPGSERFGEAFGSQRAIRSAVGRTPENKLLLVAVHNRPLGSGPSLGELAQILQQLGAVDGLNLDGGSSTGLYLGGELLDRPPQTAAPVHNGLGVFGSP